MVTTDGREFRLQSDSARRILHWYNARRPIWTKNVQKEDVEAIINAAIANDPIAVPSGAPSTSRNLIRHLHVISVRAHRFAGLHGYDPDPTQPDDLCVDLDRQLISIQGRNGSGKTSLINAITWCLTGYVHRPQRLPETTGVPLEVEPEDEDGGSVQISCISPVPPADALANGLEKDRVPIDTWVELTVSDDQGNRVGTVSRRAKRSPRGTLTEQFDDGGLGIDPIAYEIGSRMPGLIPYIQMGSKSDFGVAVSMLTGLRPVQELSRHAGRVRARLSGDFAKARKQSIDSKAIAYRQQKEKFEKFVGERNQLVALEPPGDLTTRPGLASIRAVLEEQQTKVLSAASILGPSCDLNVADTRQDLLRSVEPAIEAISFKRLRLLSSASVMVDLYKLTEEDLNVAEMLLRDLEADTAILASVHDDPPLASRLRLYARVAGWLRDEKQTVTDQCPVCGSLLESASDPHTGNLVKQHLQECFDKDADALQKTITSWEKSAVQRLRTELPNAIAKQLDVNIPDSPHKMLKRALTEELFADDCFKGALAHLKLVTSEICEREIRSLPPYEPPPPLTYPRSLGPLPKIQPLVAKAMQLVGFARWRRLYDSAWKAVFASTIGNVKSENPRAESPSTLAVCLLALRTQIETAEPLTHALDMLASLEHIQTEIEKETQRLADYEAAAKALDHIVSLNDVVRGEIDALLEVLMCRTKEWKEWLYRPATGTAPRLAAADVTDLGAISMSVKLNGTIAPAHSVANVSDLRASLIGFLFAFWEHIWKTRGGLSLLLLDDIQELFDRDNRRRVAAAIPRIVKQGAHVVCTSNDQKFAYELVHAAMTTLPSAQFERRLLHAMSATRRCIVLGVFEEDVDEKRREFEKPENENIDAPAVEYLEKVRLHAEQRLLDLFDDVIGIDLRSKPTLALLRDEAKSRFNRGVEPFALPTVRTFVDDPALQQGSLVIDLLNRCHHAGRENITFRDVSDVGEDLKRLTDQAEAAFDAYQRWLRRDQQTLASPVLVAMPRPIVAPSLDLPIRWELAAFTADLESFGHPTKENGRLTSGWFLNKAAYRITTSAFGFACPMGSLAIVDLAASDIDDSRLVIALREKKIYARRFLRNNADSAYVALGSEAPNPLKRAPSLFVRADEVRLLKVVGVLFDQSKPLRRGTPEAYEDDASVLLSSVESAFRVEGKSALPLALPEQIVLAGPLIEPCQLPTLKDAIVAVETTSGAVLKRVAGVGADDQTILLDAIGGLGGSVLAHLTIPNEPSSLPVVKKARHVIGVLYETSK